MSDIVARALIKLGSDGAQVVLPLIVINGAMDGPILMLGAAMHGLELIGPEVIRQVTREVVKPADLRGAIIAVPILNPFAFRARGMTTPQDQSNLGFLLAYPLRETQVADTGTDVAFLMFPEDNHRDLESVNGNMLGDLS